MRYICGIDGGGTKTAYLLYNPKTGEIKKRVGRSICPKDNGLSSLRNELLSNTSELCGDGAKIISVCVGLPCFGENKILDSQCTDVLSEVFPNSNRLCVNDCVVGYAGALGLELGINIVSGTGAIAYGRNTEGKDARSNGWSGEFADEGSCCWLGKKCIELFCKQADGRLPRQALYEVVKSELKLESGFDIIDYYDNNLKGNRRSIAALQKLLYLAAKGNDLSAITAYEGAAEELASSVDAVRRSIGLFDDVTVSYSGGLFNVGELILAPFEQKLKQRYSKYKLAKPLFGPDAGALLMAAEQVGLKKEEIRWV